MSTTWKKVPDSLRIRYVKRGWFWVAVFEQEWTEEHCGEVIHHVWKLVPVEDPRDYER